MAQQLRAAAALPEDCDSVPSTHARQLTIKRTLPLTKGTLMPPFGFCGNAYACAQTHTHK